MMLIFFLITLVASQDISTPATLLGPRNFNYHPFEFQSLKQIEVEPTKQGPVLFPNDGPPPPKVPLVVTSRPLIESIARSDLSQNNSITASSDVNNVAILNQNFDQPNNIQDQALFGRDFANNVEYQASSYNGFPYLAALNPELNSFGNNDYSDYGAQTALPPLYKALENHANQNVLDLKNKRVNYYQPKTTDYTNHYENKVSNDRHNPDYDEQNQNYEFSYTVKDQNTGDDFSHSQQSSGSATNGEYRVRLPDGRMQIVSYTADGNGYNANVRYDDEKSDNKDFYNINNHKNNDVNYITNANTYTSPNVYNKANNVNNNLNKLNNFNNYNNNANNPNNLFTNINYNPKPTPKTIPVHEETDASKEYNDYSSEFYNNYEPYKTKFHFSPITPTAIVPTVRPTYNVLKDLFTQRITSTPIYSDLLVSSNNPKVKYGSSTEKIVSIGNKNVYTNFVSTPRTQGFIGPTPASYLASTIAALKDRIASKPILSQSFIDRINKYITFK